MIHKRKLVQVDRPVGQPGFLGAGHIARPVIQRPFKQSDPFIMLMDDLLDKKDDHPVGGPHPHAGFETVSLLIEGEIGDGIHKMQAGDLQMMTAGSGIIHTETIDKKSHMRLLQLWLNLPRQQRWTTPRLQEISAASVPVRSEHGVHIKLYSGSLAGLSSPLKNYSPLIIADISIASNAATTVQLPAHFNTFLYVLNGSVGVGATNELVHQDQVGWLDLSADEMMSDLVLTTSQSPVRLVLYAGKPTGEDIVSHGPFIADTLEDIRRLYQEYREGKMQHISTVHEDQRMVY